MALFDELTDAVGQPDRVALANESVPWLLAEIKKGIGRYHGLDDDDALAIGYNALLTCARRWKPTGGRSFEGYRYTEVRRTMGEYAAVGDPTRGDINRKWYTADKRERLEDDLRRRLDERRYTPTDEFERNDKLDEVFRIVLRGVPAMLAHPCRQWWAELQNGEIDPDNFTRPEKGRRYFHHKRVAGWKPGKVAWFLWGARASRMVRAAHRKEAVNAYMAFDAAFIEAYPQTQRPE